MSGTIGIQGHYANGIAALAIATGQDAACVAESATGITRFEVDERGDLYASVTLPNVPLELPAPVAVTHNRVTLIQKDTRSHGRLDIP